MADDAVPLHFSKPETPVSGSTLHGLASQNLHGAPSSGMNLVVHHVLEALVVGRVQEDLSLQLAPGVPIVHHLQSGIKLPSTSQHLM